MFEDYEILLWWFPIRISFIVTPRENEIICYEYRGMTEQWSIVIWYSIISLRISHVERRKHFECCVCSHNAKKTSLFFRTASHVFIHTHNGQSEQYLGKYTILGKVDSLRDIRKFVHIVATGSFRFCLWSMNIGWLPNLLHTTLRVTYWTFKNNR